MANVIGFMYNTVQEVDNLKKFLKAQRIKQQVSKQLLPKVSVPIFIFQSEPVMISSRFSIGIREIFTLNLSPEIFVYIGMTHKI